MKFVWAIVQNDDARVLIDALTRQEYRLTRINTAGGFLKQGNATLILGVEDDQVADVLSIIERNCRPRAKKASPVPFVSTETDMGGATVFVLDLPDLRRV